MTHQTARDIIRTADNLREYAKEATTVADRLDKDYAGRAVDGLDLGSGRAVKLVSSWTSEHVPAVFRVDPRQVLIDAYRRAAEAATVEAERLEAQIQVVELR